MSVYELLSRATCAALLLALFASCDKVPSFDEAKKAVTGSVDQATQTVQNATEDVKQITGAAGTIELQLDSPVKSTGCYAALHVFSDGRPSVLQITSYNDPSGESFPSMILRAETKAKSPSELKGQKLLAKAFVQESDKSPVWQAVETPLDLTVSAADDALIAAQIQGSLINVESGKTKQTTGTLSGSFGSK